MKLFKCWQGLLHEMISQSCMCTYVSDVMRGVAEQQSLSLSFLQMELHSQQGSPTWMIQKLTAILAIVSDCGDGFYSHGWSSWTSSANQAVFSNKIVGVFQPQQQAYIGLYMQCKEIYSLNTGKEIVKITLRLGFLDFPLGSLLACNSSLLLVTALSHPASCHESIESFEVVEVGVHGSWSREEEVAGASAVSPRLVSSVVAWNKDSAEWASPPGWRGVMGSALWLDDDTFDWWPPAPSTPCCIEACPRHCSWLTCFSRPCPLCINILHWL